MSKNICQHIVESVVNLCCLHACSVELRDFNMKLVSNRKSSWNAFTMSVNVSGSLCCFSQLPKASVLSLLTCSMSREYSQHFTCLTFSHVTALFQHGSHFLFTLKFCTRDLVIQTEKVWLKFLQMFSKYKTVYISINNLCSVLCCSTFGCNYSLMSF